MFQEEHGIAVEQAVCAGGIKLPVGEDSQHDDAQCAPYTVDSPNIQRVIPAHSVFHLNGVVANDSSNQADDDCGGGRNIPGRRSDGRQSGNGSSQQAEELGLFFVEPCHEHPGDSRKRGSQIGIEKCSGGYRIYSHFTTRVKAVPPEPQ